MGLFGWIGLGLGLIGLGCQSPSEDKQGGDSEDSGVKQDSDSGEVQDSDSGPGQDSNSDSEETGEEPYQFHGTLPDQPLNAPEFEVVNQDNQSRTRADLVGQPTVIWFFPAAGTYG